MKTLNNFLKEKGFSLEDFNAKTAEEKAFLYNELNDLNAKAFKELQDNVDSTKEMIDEAKAELKDAQIEQLKSLNEALKEQGIAIKKLSIGESKKVNKETIESQLSTNVEQLKSIKEGSNEKLVVKVAGDMTTSNISGGNVPVEQRISGVNDIASRMPRLLDVVSNAVANSPVISWVYKANRDGTTGGTAEAAAKNQIDFDLVVGSENVVKRTNYIKVSDEMLDDVDFMANEIRTELIEELNRDIEAQVYEGNGTPPNLNGIRTVATAFSAGASALSIDNANAIDVIGAAIVQIKEANQVLPNWIMMHPRDVYALRSTKVSSTDKRYVERLQDVSGTLRIDGVPIMETTLVTQDEYMVGYFPLATVYQKEAVNVEIGMDADDFTKNMRTIRCEWRGACVVKNNDRTAFIYGVISTDAAALETT